MEVIVVHEQLAELHDDQFRALLYKPTADKRIAFTTTPNERLLTVALHTLSASFLLLIAAALPWLLLFTLFYAPVFALLVKSAFNRITISTEGIEYQSGFASTFVRWTEVRKVDGTGHTASVVVECGDHLKVLPDEIGGFSGRFPGMYHSSKTRPWLKSPDGVEGSYPGLVAQIIDAWRTTSRPG